MFRKKKEEYIDVDELETRQKEQEFLKKHKEKLRVERKERVKKIIEGTSKVAKTFQKGAVGLSKGIEKYSKSIPKESKISRRYVKQESYAKPRKIKREEPREDIFGLGRKSNKNMFDLGGFGVNPDIISKGKRGKNKVKEFKYF